MNENPLLDKRERESLKCLIEEKVPLLKDPLFEDALVNVDLSPTDPKGNTSRPPSPLLSFCLLILSSSFFIH